MNYFIAISFIFAALLLQRVFGGVTLYYYNRNTGNVEYNSGDNYAGTYYPPDPLYIKRYFVVIVSYSCTEALERRIWLLLHRHHFGLTTARTMPVGYPQTTVCIFPENMEAIAIYRIVLLYSIIILFNANYFTF